MSRSARKPRQGSRREKPQFLIEHDGRLFVTRALVEIDPASSDIGSSERGYLSQIQRRLREEESAARAARYMPGSGSSAVEKLLSGTIETRGPIAGVDDGVSFAATNPPSR